MLNITIIGLGPLGTSIGFALKKYCNNIGEIIGYDLSNKNQDYAKRQGCSKIDRNADTKAREQREARKSNPNFKKMQL